MTCKFCGELHVSLIQLDYGIAVGHPCLDEVLAYTDLFVKTQVHRLELLSPAVRHNKGPIGTWHLISSKAKECEMCSEVASPVLAFILKGSPWKHVYYHPNCLLALTLEPADPQELLNELVTLRAVQF